MRLTEIRFIQPGVELRGQSKLQLSSRLDKVELRVIDGWVECRDMQTGITHLYPPSLVRQSVALKSSLACPHCGQLFKSTGGMGNHVRLVHPASAEPEPVVTPLPAKPRKRAANG